MTKQTCEVVSIELEEAPEWKLIDEGRWVVTVDHPEKSEFEIPENPSTSQVEAALAEKLAELEDSDADLEAEISAHTSPMTPDTTYSLDTVKEVETDEQDDSDDSEDDDREVATDGGEEIDVAHVDETTSEQDDVVEWLATTRSGDSRDWTIEVDTINDGRPAVRVSWESGADISFPTIDEEWLPHGWTIGQFGVGVSSEIGESDDKRYLVIVPQKATSEPAMYDALARELTASELRDYLAVDRFGYSQTGWADESGLNRSNISERVNSARRKLE